MLSRPPKQRSLSAISLPHGDREYSAFPYGGLAWISDGVLGDATFPVIGGTF